MASDKVIQTASTGGIGMSMSVPYTVKAQDTVGHLVPGMPMVAATPYLVTIAEMVCYEIAKKLIEPDHFRDRYQIGSEHYHRHTSTRTCVITCSCWHAMPMVLAVWITLSLRACYRVLHVARAACDERLVVEAEVSPEVVRTAIWACDVPRFWHATYVLMICSGSDHLLGIALDCSIHVGTFHPSQYLHSGVPPHKTFFQNP